MKNLQELQKMSMVLTSNRAYPVFLNTQRARPDPMLGTNLILTKSVLLPNIRY